LRVWGVPLKGVDGLGAQVLRESEVRVVSPKPRPDQPPCDTITSLIGSPRANPLNKTCSSMITHEDLSVRFSFLFCVASVRGLGLGFEESSHDPWCLTIDVTIDPVATVDLAAPTARGGDWSVPETYPLRFRLSVSSLVL